MAAAQREQVRHAMRMQHLGDADVSSMLPSQLGDEGERFVDSITSTQLEQEQLLDYLTIRLFRRTLLCRSDVTLDREIDLSRGDMLAKPNNQPTVGHDIDLMLCWFSEKKPLQVRGKYVLRHTTKECRAVVKDVHYKVDVNTLHKNEEDRTVNLNDIARVTLRTSAPTSAGSAVRSADAIVPTMGERYSP